MGSPSPADGLHLQHGGFSASRGAHGLLPPGEILSLEGARVQGTRRLGVTVFLASRNGTGRRVYPGSQRDLGELGPGAPQR